MSVEKAAEYLQIPIGTLYMKLTRGEIPATKPGKRYVLYRDELDKWLEANRKNPVPMTVGDKAKNQLIIDFEDLGCSTRRVRGPLETRLFALRWGVGSRIGRHVAEPMLARLLNCTVSHYQRMERGKHPFKDKHLRKLAEYYGVGFCVACF